MKLILKDYIATLKEEKELEGLLYNILFLENYRDFTLPQKGIRQHGVDLSCKKGKTSYLFVIKQGDIDRAVWNSNKNSVRQSLDEIKDAYLHLNGEFIEDKVKIILCTNGEIRQDVRQDWDGYIANNKRENLEYCFWGIDDITNYVIKLIPNEYLVDQNKMTLLRKTLYFSNETENDLRYFDKLLDEIIEEMSSQKRNTRIYKKNLYLYVLVTKMCSRNYIESRNNRVAININEKAMIKLWAYIMKKNLYEKNNEVSMLIEITKEYEIANDCYLKNIETVSKYQPSFNIYNSLEYKLQVYECIGIISAYLNYLLYFYGYTKKVQEYKCILTTILNNNLSGWTFPVYDLHSIEINSLLHFYYNVDREECKMILSTLLKNMKLKLEFFNYHPIEGENYDKAILLELKNNIGNFESTNLIFILFEWAALFEEEELINDFIMFLKEKFTSLSYNPWTITPTEELSYFVEKQNYNIGEYIEYYDDLKYETIKLIMKKSLEISKYEKFNTIIYNCEPYFWLAAKINRIPIPSFFIEKHFNNN